jgi:hypothetical protein
MLKRALFGGIAALALAACEPEATPLPVDIVPATSPIATQGAAQTLRYAIDSNLFLIIPPDDVNAIAVTGEIEPISPPFLDTDLGNRYDILIALGDLPDGTRAPTPITVSLALNTSLSPLDDNALAEIVRRSLDTEALAAALGIPSAEALPHTHETPQTLRTSLANAGLPDGFDLNVASLYAPGTEAVGEQLAVIGIETRIRQIASDEASDLSPYHLILFSSGARVLFADMNSENSIDLFTVPISYRAAPDLTIEFTDSGLPLVRR